MFLLRFPEELRDQIARAAAKNNRSLTAEVIDRLEKSVMLDEELGEEDVGTNTVARRFIEMYLKTMPPLLDMFGGIENRLERLQQTLESRPAIPGSHPGKERGGTAAVSRAKS
jgi:Arc-like DNA binding domain